MTGDFSKGPLSRQTPASADRGLALQQGRILLDSDYNRMQDLLLSQMADLGRDSLCDRAFMGSAFRVGRGVLLLTLPRASSTPRRPNTSSSSAIPSCRCTTWPTTAGRRPASAAARSTRSS